MTIKTKRQPAANSLITLADYCGIFHCSEKTASRDIRQGIVRETVRIKRRIYIPQHEVDRLIQQNTSKATA